MKKRITLKIPSLFTRLADTKVARIPNRAEDPLNKPSIYGLNPAFDIKKIHHKLILIFF